MRSFPASDRAPESETAQMRQHLSRPLGPQNHPGQGIVRLRRLCTLESHAGQYFSRPGPFYLSEGLKLLSCCLGNHICWDIRESIDAIKKRGGILRRLQTKLSIRVDLHVLF